MHKKTPPKTVEQIKMMMYVGTSVADIAKATGVSRSRIYEIRNDLIKEQQQLIREFSAPITGASDARKRLSKLMGFVSSFSSGVSAEEERKKSTNGQNRGVKRKFAKSKAGYIGRSPPVAAGLLRGFL